MREEEEEEEEEEEADEGTRTLDLLHGKETAPAVRRRPEPPTAVAMPILGSPRRRDPSVTGGRT
jgi:hypothetical protein